MELIIGGAAAVVALCALGVSVLNTYYMRQLDKQSVMPLLDLDMRKVRSERDEKTYYGVYLKNNGTGPAIVKAFRLTYGGFDISDPRAVELLREDTQSFLGEPQNDLPTFLSVLKDEEVIAPGDGHILFGVSFDDTGRRTFQFQDTFCSKTECTVETESVYRDRKILTLDGARAAFARARTKSLKTHTQP
ncbi:hypothetical protein DU478_21545 [Thalassococcus profundi]|uniref:Uncharacterized protein n=1 Tax=Thalassococcus profundi TaxID=2282382 RepID=A0A369TJ90_9RHOB|nr:hypothetical protein [Thalassococcus profundi]RDD64197.1 hypothetical protein DU478_21545 [Thalassococcus profundi]